ncbi:ABC transporter ATP-binding protein [Sediminibacillus albus]|uniref:Putative ABC transport system ATP-binding protein n=1 Tax=Sediminibacillus albus TaxID=407036 RepID=A0A1G9CU33_9BACI|nr:phosphate ABC transporter ATP-binding protein [Sediminibacillus albus]SDK54945.1 putative ABC transport system ATP-binding protein [Sediminibacillus albus]
MNNEVFVFSGVSTPQLSNIEFKINKGEKVVLFGPSGAGKSSLLFLFNRLKDPTEGRIHYRDKPITDYHVASLRKQVGLVMQSHHLFPGTVYDNLQYGPSLFESWDEGQASELLEMVALPQTILHKNVNQLSGGEKQRISFARTLANRPDVLLLDEPTSALDERTTEEIEDLLKMLGKEKNLTMIMVTHDLSQAKRLGDRGMFMSEGKLLVDQPVEEIFTSPENETLKNFLNR